MTGCCCCRWPWGGARTAGKPLAPTAARCDAERSSCSFSCTFFNGTSSSSWIVDGPGPPSVDGSGMGPSMTQRFDSYFVRMKFSILFSLGMWPATSFASQYRFALSLPHCSILSRCSSVHESRVTDLTLLICTPRPRCIPEHLMHRKMPRFQLAQRGDFCLLQSAQVLLGFCGENGGFVFNKWSRSFLFSSASLGFRAMPSFRRGGGASDMEGRWSRGREGNGVLLSSQADIP